MKTMNHSCIKYLTEIVILKERVQSTLSWKISRT